MKSPLSPIQSIKKWSENERPREKLMLSGASSLSDAELLAILIGSGTRDESAVQLSIRILLSVNNDLKQLARLGVMDLVSSFKGIGDAKAVTIIAALELGKRRSQATAVEKGSVFSSRDAFDLFHAPLCDLPFEELWVAFINRASKVIAKRRFSQGGSGDAPFDIRLILKEALAHLATGIIVCHNHPSGNVQPSIQDDNMTQRLYKAAKMMDIILMDHIILTEDKYYSYADQNRLTL